ncbi:AAA family ATPase [Kitasatospora sp. NPDC056181]|uniref:helix-turn-helix transcriptional regulator n=1 Tax=Kitasatospora sp. NPDC056181 TaxID=3345737 RepID=UPI0035D9227A
MTVGRSGDRRITGASPAPAFVGRERELAVLLSAARSRPSVVLVEGPAGIGKSRLIAEASAVLAAEGVRVLTGRCHPLREPLAYGPVIEALRDADAWLPPREGALGASAGWLAALLPDLADRLPPPPHPAAGPVPARHQIAQAVRTVLDAVSPALLVIDDVHWADEATRELLLLLGRDLPADAALLLAYRAEDLPGRGPLLGAAFRRPPNTSGAELALGPLTEQDVTDMARSVLGPAATPALVRALHSRSEGLALVAEEDLLALRDHPGGVPGGVPRSLREVFAERADRLPRAAAALADAAAVLEVPVGEGLLADTVGLEPAPAAEALTAALTAGVLRELGPDRYGFTHALARRAHYDNIPGPERTRLHRRALAVLWTLPNPPLVQIAHHTRQLGDTGAWLEHALAAADQAVEVGDQGTAATLLHEILEEPRLPSALHARAALSLARIAWDATEYTRTIATLRRIVAGPGLPAAARGEIRLDLGLMLLNQAADPSGEAEIERAVDELVDDRPELAARAMSVLAMWETSRFSAAEQRAWIERAQATIADSDDRAARASVTANRITLMASMGVPGTDDELAALPREDQDPEVVRHTARALANAAEVGICLGQDERAARHTEESLALAERHHAHALIVHCRSYRLLLSWTAGEWSDWEERYAAFRADYLDEPLAVDDLLATVQGITAAARGRTARAVERFGRVLARDPQRKNVNALGAAAGLARVQLARGDDEEAWRTVTDYLPLLPRKEQWVYAWDLAPAAVEIALHRGDPAGAEDLAAQHRAGIEGADAPGAQAESLVCEGLVLRAQDPDGAADRFDRARLLWSAIGRPYHAALAGEQTARALAGLHDGRAAALLTGIVEVHERLGATSDAARCVRLLRDLGQERPRPRGRAGYGDRLSPREQQVGRLLADGATNKDIAAALFLSPRTVEQHVAKVLRKLGCTRDEVRDRTI